MKSISEQLDKFIKDSEYRFINNLWLRDDSMSVYVRKARHVLYPGKMSLTLDIAAVEVEEKMQRQGIFTRFLSKAHALNPWEATFVENAHAPHLAKFLMTHGWLSQHLFPESFFMLK